MSTIRGKFRCGAVTFHGDPNNTDTPRTYELSAVYDQRTPENARFARATPWGELKMRIDNPAARLETGVEYYLDFTPCAEVHAQDEWDKAEETVEDHSRDVSAS